MADFTREEVIEKVKNGESLAGADLSGLDLKKVNLERANLAGVYFADANLAGANLYRADLNGANFAGASLAGASLYRANLNGANFAGADVSKADLEKAILSSAVFTRTNLYKTCLFRADLKGASFDYSNLSSAHFGYTVVNNITIFSCCYTDEKTDFTEVNLDMVNITPQQKATLESNVRCIWWRSRYSILSPIRWFWIISDYGRSTKRIIFFFLYFSFIFANIYYTYPGLIDKLEYSETGGFAFNSYVDDPFLRSLYFSIVTMTTLGFGDMHAARDNYAYVLLMIHVIIGYVLLAALVVRLGTLFTSLPPVHRRPYKEPHFIKLYDKLFNKIFFKIFKNP